MAQQTVRITGRILYLCENADVLAAQLVGHDLDAVPTDLCNNISTDEMTPGWVCFWYDETLGRYALVGLRGGKIGRDSIKQGGFEVLVAGHSNGCGSSRETAPYAQKAAGIRVVIARSHEKIYAQNCQNIGLLTSTDFGLIERIRRGESIERDAFTQGLDPIACAVVEHGGLFAYNKARLHGDVAPALSNHPRRPLTLAEKILAAHAVTHAREGHVGINAVYPGDALFCRTDVRFSHDYVTPMASALFYDGFGAKARVRHPERVFAFRDHLTFLGAVMPEAQKKQGLLALAEDLAPTQAAFCAEQGIRLYAESPNGGSEAICHNAVLEDIATPGTLVVGTDSHTCTAGALGCLAFGIGATDMANAWLTEDVRVTVPHSVRIELRGALKPGVCAKDVMLAMMAAPYFKQGRAIGQVLEFCGDGIATLPIDERATLTNMAVEAGATTGIVAADAVTAAYLVSARGMPSSEALAMAVQADAGATYAHSIVLNLPDIEPMVATPGDPRNGLPVAQLPGRIDVNIAYGGSCTGGKKTDMDLYAGVLREAVARGLRVKAGVQLYIQFGSQKIRQHAVEQGYVALFERAGATLINPSCGACIKAGPGVSDSPDQVTVSAINRNFPGRSGPGQVYLASPQVVAASAIAGYIVTPETLFAQNGR